MMMEVDDDHHDEAEATSYSQVRHKKVQGSLTLHETGLDFAAANLTLTWIEIAKHQVSPSTYPKPLLKLVFGSPTTPPLTFELSDRIDLERIRKDITHRLQRTRNTTTTATTTAAGGFSSSTKKRSLADLATAYKSTTTTFGEMDPIALAVTRSSLLAAHPALRQQHTYLVQETQTIGEDDFWYTHKDLVEDEYAKIVGYAQAGTSSLLQSHLPVSGKVQLGVEEMRQIFIMYPAVHKAYEEKVPLELSDEQFWRKYLESEYFHRDRGRMGAAARDHGTTTTATNPLATAASATRSATQAAQGGDSKATTGPTVEEQDARAAAVGTDDLFSRYDQKLQERETMMLTSTGGGKTPSSKQLGGRRPLAVGQFDLASTFATERGNLLEGPKDNHPPNALDIDGKGARVIRKYNRHWAMVLHPEDAVAGADLTAIAANSVLDPSPEAEPGGVDDEMRRLVDFANASEDDANHAAGLGGDTSYEPLTLQNVEAYHVGAATRQSANGGGGTGASEEAEAAQRHAVFARSMVAKIESLTKPLNASMLNSGCFPTAALGRELLAALTKKMAQDSRTEAASLEMVHKLPEDFRKNLHAYFRRSSELLRHFFGLRKVLEEQGQGQGGTRSSDSSQKLARIVAGMETFYREMEGMRKAFPQSETGELMRKMCLPIMDQLDWAFQLHREGSGGGGGGGFVAVDEI